MVLTVLAATCRWWGSVAQVTDRVDCDEYLSQLWLSLRSHQCSVDLEVGYVYQGWYLWGDKREEYER